MLDILANNNFQLAKEKRANNHSRLSFEEEGMVELS